MIEVSSTFPKMSNQKVLVKPTSTFSLPSNTQHTNSPNSKFLVNRRTIGAINVADIVVPEEDYVSHERLRQNTAQMGLKRQDLIVFTKTSESSHYKSANSNVKVTTSLTGSKELIQS